MVAMYLSSLLIGAGALVSAAPAGLDARAGCTFTDAASAIKGKAACSAIILKGIVVPAGTTLDLTGLKAGTSVTFEGTTSFGYKEWEGPLISVSGTNVKVIGAPGNVIDGNGPKWWDGKGGNGGKKKPKFFFAHSMKQSSITGLNVKNTPVQGFSINTCTGLTLDHITIDNTAGDTATNAGHNTDAFDVGSSSGITISNAVVRNQDDCLAVNSGTDIHFINGFCSGGHGISIGSVGGRSDNVVKGVTITGSTIENSDNGVRIKTISGATGSVSGVTYKDITLKNIQKYGIVIQQDYLNGSPTGKPTTGVPITGLTIQNVKGTVAAKGTNVYILCGKGSCSGWTWAGNSVTGGKKSTACQNIPSGGASC
ncbi:glycoside hydrolase family 28 protein [Cucurbitaria berberidis CBS 394.84]|uniref:endo-polygalacturonase n=1 Tax=Cucurbitaria berberidis CBS 394.84 TaxID=1168544 RepID=A0A9P4GBT7_9PLEO|nr:glycoside hydrolase family 28 protein [Cucurbitaria berberidis CBS 394.84]KAF1842973.1 glycoside hydrolase family 28 protein [Cucurbitaria berberidis CBS 394.84]